MNLCDSCGSDAIEHGLSKPLSIVHGVNNTRWHMGSCQCCGKITDLASYPSINIEKIQILKKYIGII